MALCYPCRIPDDVTAELERLRAENAQLKRTANRGVSLKVSEKGGRSVYGLGRFPVTLYKEQWTKLLDMADDIHGNPARTMKGVAGPIAAGTTKGTFQAGRSLSYRFSVATMPYAARSAAVRNRTRCDGIDSMASTILRDPVVCCA